MKMKKVLPIAAAGVFALSTSAMAASFSLDLTGGSFTTLDTDYSLPIPTLPFAIVDFQDTVNNGISQFGGLLVNPGNAKIKATYMGSEAGASNGAELNFGNGLMFSNQSSVAGDFFVFDNIGASGTTPGTSFVDLVFSTDNLGGLDTIDNADGTATDSRLHMAFTDITNATGDVTELFAFFGDGAGDSDYDDMVIKLELISAVPVPASVLLMASGLAGFGALRRKKKA